MLNLRSVEWNFPMLFKRTLTPQWLLFLCAGGLLQGCASSISLQDISQQHNLDVSREGALELPVATLSRKGRSEPSSILRVYIEGDGHAWATGSSPSLDPTPRSRMVVDLFLADPEPAAYLGRPCQYVTGDACHQSVWTNARFSQSAVSSMSAALDALKAKYQASTLELVGYSGGAAIALLLAEQRNDVAVIQTIAGNLDPTAWVEIQHLDPLTGSLDPLTHSDRLVRIRQRHLVGINDRVVPPSLTYGFKAKVQGCQQIVEVSASHADGWLLAWPAYRDTSVPCQ